MATPGFFVRSSISSSRNRGRAEHLDDDVRRDVDRLLVALGATPGRLAAQRADLALEVADARLARVAADDRAQRGLVVNVM